LVSARIVSHLFNATCLKEDGNPNFVSSPHSLTGMGRLANLGFQLVSKNLSGHHLDLSLLENCVNSFYQALTYGFVSSSFFSLNVPLLILYGVFFVFILVFDLISLWLVFSTPYFVYMKGW
jgi:hypothetical protein